MVEGVKWFRRMFGGESERSDAVRQSGPPGELRLSAAQLENLELYVEQLRNEVDTKVDALVRAGMENEALRAELTEAVQKLGASVASLAEAQQRADDAEQRLDSQVQFDNNVLTSARRRQDEITRRAEAAEVQAVTLEHKLQHAESAAQSLGLERQSLLSKIASLDERCGALADELGWVQAHTARRDAELVRLRAEAALRSSGSPEAARVDDLRRSLQNLVGISAHALDALVGASSHIALGLACRSQREHLEAQLGVASSREDAVARTREHLAAAGLVAALDVEGGGDERALRLALVPVADAEAPSRRWLAAYAVECINACSSGSFRVEGVEGSPQRFRVSAVARAFDAPEAALRSA
jgi:chromosome segregation ATPase